MSNFENAKFIPGNRKQTRITDGLVVSGEIKGHPLHQIFGTENLENIDMGYAQIFAASTQYAGKPILGMTQAKGKIKTIDRRGFRWQLSGGDCHKGRITGIGCTDPKPGYQKQTFDIIVDKPWFSISDVVIPQDQEYPCVVVPIQDNAYSRAYIMEGSNQYRYTLSLITDSLNEFLPSEYLQLQQEWYKVSSLVADEDNQDGGGFNFYSVFENEGQIQQFACKFECSDKTAKRVYQAKKKGKDLTDDLRGYDKMLWVKLGDGKVKGEPLAGFMSVMEAKMLDRLYSDCEWSLIFGKHSSTLQSPEGHRMLTTSGLRQQLESGWKLEHNGNLSLQQMEDWFDNILRDRISEGKQKIVLSAGREFRKMFDRMIKADARTFVTIDTLYIRKGEDYRHLDYGSYFAHYKGFSVDISVMENPAYDSSAMSPKLHPTRTDVTIDSFRADILDFGYAGEQGTGMTTDNICMVQESASDYDIKYNGKYYCHDGKSGMPITDGGLGQAGGVSGFTMLKEKSAGLLIADVTRCGTIKLAL